MLGIPLQNFGRIALNLFILGAVVYVFPWALVAVLVIAALFCLMLFLRNKDEMLAGLRAEDASTKSISLETTTADQLCSASNVAATCAALSAEGNWDKLHQIMRDWDMQRATSGGRRLTHIGGKAARHKQTAHIERAQEWDECGPVAARNMDYDELERLELAFATRPKDHILAAILALAHHEAGFARRGSAWAHQVPPEGWEGYSLHMQRASEIVEEFDSQALGSPYFAHVAHIIAMDREDADKAIFPAFETLMALDHTNWEAYALHGYRLLPRWYGDQDTLEVKARQAMAQTQEHIGAAAYAAMYLTAMDMDEDAYHTLDVELFGEGVCDMLTATDNDQVMVNEVLANLFEVCIDNAAAFAKKSDPRVIRRKAMLDVIDMIIRNHLVCHVTDVWDEKPKAVLQYLAECYEDELEQGQVLRFTRNGRDFSPPPTSSDPV